MNNKEKLLEANKELVEKLSIRNNKYQAVQPRVTLGEVILLKYPQTVTPKQLKRLKKLSIASNDSIKLRDALRTVQIPYGHKYVKNRVKVDYNEDKKPIMVQDYGTRIISLK